MKAKNKNNLPPLDKWREKPNIRKKEPNFTHLALTEQLITTL